MNAWLLINLSLSLSLQVNVEMVLKTLKENGVNATKLIVETVPMIASEDWTKTLQENKVCVCVCVCGNRKQEALLLRKTPNIIFVFHVNVCVYV